MPMIAVRYVTPREDEDFKPRIAALASRLAHEKLGKDPGVTAVMVEAADPAGWFIAGKRPVDAGLAAFWLDIKISAGTNVKGDTTAFVRAMYDGMAALIDSPMIDRLYIYIFKPLWSSRGRSSFPKHRPTDRYGTMAGPQLRGDRGDDSDRRTGTPDLRGA